MSAIAPVKTLWVGADKVPIRLCDMTNLRVLNLERYLRGMAKKARDCAIADASNWAWAEGEWQNDIDEDLLEADSMGELFLHPVHNDALLELRRRGLKPKEDWE